MWPCTPQERMASKHLLWGMLWDGSGIAFSLELLRLGVPAEGVERGGVVRQREERTGVFLAKVPLRGFPDPALVLFRLGVPAESAGRFGAVVQRKERTGVLLAKAPVRGLPDLKNLNPYGAS